MAGHVALPDQAIGQLPESVAAGHRVGNDPDRAKCTLVVRADSAGCTAGFVAACRKRNVRFFVIA